MAEAEAKAKFEAEAEAKAAAEDAAAADDAAARCGRRRCYAMLLLLPPPLQLLPPPPNSNAAMHSAIQRCHALRTKSPREGREPGRRRGGGAVKAAIPSELAIRQSNLLGSMRATQPDTRRCADAWQQPAARTPKPPPPKRGYTGT